MADRYDITLCPAAGGHPLADAGVRHYLRGLFTRGLIAPDGEHHGDPEIRIFMKPGPWAHTAFMEGGAPSEPVFLEAELRFGAPAVPPGGEGEAHFWLCFRGALREQAGARFKGAFETSLDCRARSWSVPHEGLPPRPEASAPTTTEEPAEASPASPVGTRVEEY